MSIRKSSAYCAPRCTGAVFAATRTLAESPAGEMNLPSVAFLAAFAAATDDFDFSKNDTLYCKNGDDDDMNGTIGSFVRKYPIRLWIENGFFELCFLQEVNKHWLEYDPQSPNVHRMLAFLYFVIMITGVVGNGLVIVMYINCKSLRTPANMFVLNLACSDLLMMGKMPIFIYNSIFEGPALGRLGCISYGFLGGLSGCCSICTLTAISLDRCYVVKFPLHTRLTNTGAKCCILFCWLYSLCFSVIPLCGIGLGAYTAEGFLTSCSFDYLSEKRATKNFLLVFFSAAWIVPLVIIIYSYVNILHVVVRARHGAKNSFKESTRHQRAEERKRQEVRLAFLVFLVIMLWFTAWTPYALVALMGVFGAGNYITPLSSMIPALFCKTASCFDPFVYALSHPKFKEELKRICFRRRHLKQERIKMWTTQSHEPNRVNDSADIMLTDVCKPEVKSTAVIAKKPDKVKLSWWYRPSFKNRTSSIRKIARHVSRRNTTTTDDSSSD